MSKLKIRQVKLDDLEIITRIEMTCFPSSEAASKKAFEERINIYPKGFFVAEINHNIIGFINGGATNDDHIEDAFFGSMKLHQEDGKNLVIFGLDVHPNYQRKGYARAVRETD